MNEREVLELILDVVNEADQHVTLRRGLRAALDRRLVALPAAAQADGEEGPVGRLSTDAIETCISFLSVNGENDLVRAARVEVEALRARPAPSPVKVNMLEHANGIEVREVLSDGTDRMVVVVPRDVFIPAPSQALVDVDDVLRTVHAAIASWTHPGMSEHDVWICYDKAIRRALACATLPAAKKDGGA